MSETTFKVIKKERPKYIIKLLETERFKVVLKEETSTTVIVADGGEF